MEIVWLEKWWGLTLPGQRLGYWRAINRTGYASSEGEVIRVKSNIITDVGTKPEDVDGLKYRWVVKDIPAELELVQTPV